MQRKNGFSQEEEDFLKGFSPVLTQSKEDKDRREAVTYQFNETFGGNRTVKSIVMKHRRLNGLYEYRKPKAPKATKSAPAAKVNQNSKLVHQRYSPEENAFISTRGLNRKVPWSQIARDFTIRFQRETTADRLNMRYKKITGQSKEAHQANPSPTNEIYVVKVAGKEVWRGEVNPTGSIEVMHTSVVGKL